MLKVRPHKQKPGRCGPASLKMVLGFFRIEASERKLAKLSKCTAEGTKAEGLVSAARKLGCDAYIKDHAEIADIRKQIRRRTPPIVDWLSTDEGHYSVVVGIDRKKIHMQDPELGRVRTMEIKRFKRVWFDFSGPLISAEKLHIRRMIVVRPKERNRIA